MLSTEHNRLSAIEKDTLVIGRQVLKLHISFAVSAQKQFFQMIEVYSFCGTWTRYESTIIVKVIIRVQSLHAVGTELKSTVGVLIGVTLPINIEREHIALCIAHDEVILEQIKAVHSGRFLRLSDAFLLRNNFLVEFNIVGGSAKLCL